MKFRYLLIAAGLLAIVAVAAFWAASLPEPSPTQSQLSPPAAIQTPVPGGTADEALRLAAVSFMSGSPPLVLAHPQSVAYFETTVGEARRLFEPDGPRTAPDVSDATQAWVFVAYGQFQYFCMGCAVHFSPIYTTVVAVITKDGQRRFGLGSGTEQYDLSQLGTPLDVPSSVLQQLCDELVGSSSQAQLC